MGRGFCRARGGGRRSLILIRMFGCQSSLRLKRGFPESPRSHAADLGSALWTGVLSRAFADELHARRQGVFGPIPDGRTPRRTSRKGYGIVVR